MGEALLYQVRECILPDLSLNMILVTGLIFILRACYFDTVADHEYL